MTFNEFCENICDNLYNSKLSDNNQCTGYYKLCYMVEKGITPADKEEMERYYHYPCIVDLMSVPHLKYLTFLHPLLRPFIIDNWEKIKTFSL